MATVQFNGQTLDINNVKFTYNKKETYLTARNIKLIKALIASGSTQISTKLTCLSIHSGDGDGNLSIDIYERYAIASRSFDLRPEAKIVKWHLEQKVNIKVVKK